MGVLKPYPFAALGTATGQQDNQERAILFCTVTGERMKPTWENKGIQLYLGDCLDVLPTLGVGSVDAVVTDPPWGIGFDCDYTRFSGGLADNRNHHRGFPGDDQPFDPSPWLDFPHVILWGWNHYADQTPKGTILIWLKKRDSQLGTFLSDAEMGWQKGGQGIYVFRHIWHGFDRETERGQRVTHPSQKPVALMAWCLDRTSISGNLVLDPYMGSGTTGVACVQTGRKFIGIEIDPGYFEIARQRIEAAQNEYVQDAFLD